MSIDSEIEEYLEVLGELDDIKDSRREFMTKKSEYESNIKDKLKKTNRKFIINGQNKIYLSEHQTVKGLSAKLLEMLLTDYLKDPIEAKKMATYVWANRPVEKREYIKVIRVKRK